MKKQKHLLTLILLIVTLSSCGKILMSIYGIHKPKKICEKTILKFAHNFDIDTSTISILDYNGFKNKFEILKGLNDVIIFDSSGAMVVPYDAKSCKGTRIDFLQQFKDSSNVYLSDSLRLEDLTSNLYDLQGTQKNLDINNKKYIAIIYSADFAGRLNINYTKAWNLQLKQDSSVQIINIICDPNQTWSDQEVSKIRNQL